MGLFGIAGLGALVGGASMIWACHARTWTVHAVLAAGTGLVCLCVYFSGVATAIYPMMFVWVVLVAASFFGRRAVAAHVSWIVVSWGLVLFLVKEPTGFSPITRWALGSLALGVAAAVMSEIVAGRKLTEMQLRSAQEELEDLAHHDPLTGIANRRLFEQELSRELAGAKRRGAPLSVVAIDLDNFKKYNDEHGHVAGDRLLKSAVSAWGAELRDGDLIARIGGDEFLVLLPDCPSPEAERVAQRLCSALPSSSVGCTCSTGLAVWDAHESAEDLLSRADGALYETKHGKQTAPFPNGTDLAPG